jgi:undecaprenyl diphosphate synthase
VQRVTSPTANSSLVPAHVAIVMDGNGRWARARHLPRTAGHKRGVDATHEIVEACANRGVRVLTLFAFSSENWRRPQAEVRTLMELFFSTLRSEARQLAEKGVRLRFIGDRGAFPQRLQDQICHAEALTERETAMGLNIAANYGGRWDITQAVRRLAEQTAAGRIAPQGIGDEAIAARLSTGGLPDPDLFIRTGGEHRISNFLLWQLAYTELYFTDTLWPDFDAIALDLSFQDYARRQRRFGRTGEQVEQTGQAGRRV